MELLKEIGEWLRLVAEHWHGWVSGGILAFALEIMEKVWKQKLTRKAFLVVLSLGFLCSIFAVWQDQYHATEAAQVKVDELTKPKLTAEFGGAYVPVPANPSDIVVTVNGVIKNQGAPTVLDNFGFYLVLKDGRQITGKLVMALQKPSQSVEFYGESKDDLILRLEGSDNWLRNVSSTPIPQGGGRSGWLQFVLPNTTVEEVFGQEAVPHLVTHDITTREWTFQQPLIKRTGLAPTMQELSKPLTTKRR